MKLIALTLKLFIMLTTLL